MKNENVVRRIFNITGVNRSEPQRFILSRNIDPDGKIIGFYYQKISSPEAEKFRGRSFTDQFIGLTLADFYKSGDSNGRVAAIKDPTEKNHEDFKATIRGTKKNLILLDKFILGGAQK